MLTFGQATLIDGDDKPQFILSDDKKAFTLLPSGIEITLQPGESPVATRVFTLIVPVEGYGKKADIAVHVGGITDTHDGTTATMVSTVNGQSTVSDFVGKDDDSFTQSIKFTADGATECRLSVLLLVGRNSRNRTDDAIMKVSTIDAEIVSQAE
jgi:hypothetical protein